MKHVVIAGGGGLIGSLLAPFLAGQGYPVVILTRNPASPQSPSADNLIRPVYWDGKSDGPWRHSLENAAALINLAGENIGARRWTAARKEQLLSSRLNPVSALRSGLSRLNSPPPLWLQASAAGYYGPEGDQPRDENAPPGDGFLAHTAKEWEAAALSGQLPRTRVVLLRFGVALTHRGGALARMIPPFRYFLGGPLGNGQQWFSWIHEHDLNAAILFILRSDTPGGPYNLTAPEPVRNAEFTAHLARTLKKPAFLKLPGALLRALLGEMAHELLLSGTPAIPRRLLNEGFTFRFPTVGNALKDLLPPRKTPVNKTNP